LCHERWFRRRERDERFEEELRFLLDDRARERSEPPTPIVERDPDMEADTERAPDEAPVVRR
jgi:hypothetical protein